MILHQLLLQLWHLFLMTYVIPSMNRSNIANVNSGSIHHFKCKSSRKPPGPKEQGKCSEKFSMYIFVGLLSYLQYMKTIYILWVTMKAIEITTSSDCFYTVSLGSRRNDGRKALLQGHRPTTLRMNSKGQVAGADATCCSFPKRLPPLLPYFKPMFARLEKGGGKCFSHSLLFTYLCDFIFILLYHIILLEILLQLNIGPAKHPTLTWIWNKSRSWNWNCEDP